MIRVSFGKAAARTTLIGGLALLALPAVAGCEAGLNAPTLEFHAASAGATTVFNGISISDAFVLGAPSGSSVPTGSKASLFVGLFNNGSSDDKLVSVSAPGVASSVTITGGSVTIPAVGSANLTGPEPKVVLNGLTKSLSNGEDVPVTLDFATAGAVTLDVPVEPQSFNWATYSPPPVPAASPTTSAASSATASPSTTGSPSTGATPSTNATPSTSPSSSPSATATK
ncbi:MAG TPA: copper chaperone PCu(A)C [Trebonia sp.]|nr:copper chaperone PCu(A)C [Trebonia sp.]